MSETPEQGQQEAISSPASEHAKVHTVPARALWRYLWIPLAFVAGLGLGYLLWGRQEETAPAPVQAAQPRRYDVSTDDDPALGPEDAPILLIEFSDFNCPFCRKWQADTFPVLMASYPDQIRFVYRDLPVVGGGRVGLEAAQAANCAGDQGAFWDYHDALFSGRYGLSRQAYLQYARDLGLDASALEECLDSGYHEQEVLDDRSYALGLGVASTPTFFLNGIPIVGAQPTEVFLQVVEAELDRAQ
ncbi:MAG: thioredoxin domain-containing protein [Chloroflexota bacterium]